MNLLDDGRQTTKDDDDDSGPVFVDWTPWSSVGKLIAGILKRDERQQEFARNTFSSPHLILQLDRHWGPTTPDFDDETRRRLRGSAQLIERRPVVLVYDDRHPHKKEFSFCLFDLRSGDASLVGCGWEYTPRS